MQSCPFSRTISFVLSWSLLAGLSNLEQVSAQNTSHPGLLNIVVLEGDGAVNNIKQKIARDVTVRVEDTNHKPLPGAIVTFVSPQQGASGTFLNGSKNVQEVTNVKGVAVTRGFQPNKATGSFQIKVKASYDGQTGATTINQTNAAENKGFLGLSAKQLIVIGSIAAVGVGAGIAAGSRSSGSGAATGTTITAGSATVGIPH
jgi:hypothetical protein